MTRTETISIVDATVVEQLEDDDPGYAVSINTSGETKDRVALKAALSREYDVDVDEMHEEVPADIGTVTFNDHGEIDAITLKSWVTEKYQTD